MSIRSWAAVLSAFLLGVGSAGWASEGSATPTAGGGSGGEKEHHADGHSSSRITDEVIPLDLENFPERPRPPIELGNHFLGTGTLWPGFELPTGAVWQPALFAFGTWRNAVQTLDDGFDTRTELRTRMDLFLNLQLSGSERIIIGVRPFDEDGAFTRYVFDGPEDSDFYDELDLGIESLFFEGDFGEIFPNLSRDDFRRTDYGFSVGRQSLIFQEGFVLGDALDSLGVTRNTLLPKGTSNFRVTYLGAWDSIHRNGVEDEDAQLFGLLTSTDFRRSTVDVDAVYVQSDAGLGDQIVVGASAVQRFGHINTTFRLVGSAGLDDFAGAAGDGGIFTSEVSWTPHHTDNHAYINAFVAVDDFSPAARAPGTGGVLSGMGIGFSGSGLGFPGPLDSSSRDVVGAVFGYQKIAHDLRSQWVFEVASRIGLDDAVTDSVAATVRWQRALRKHYVVVLDGFGGWVDSGGGDDTLYGARLELLTKF